MEYAGVTVLTLKRPLKDILSPIINGTPQEKLFDMIKFGRM